jgi:ribokinase
MARLLVVGSSNTDVTIRLPSLPAPGQTVLGGTLGQGPGGKGANQAVAAARAGAQVTFVSAVGDDAYGLAAREHYTSEGLDLTYLKTVPGVPSGVALIFVAEADGGENLIGVASGANARLTPDDINALPRSVFEEHQALLVAGLEVPLETVVRAVDRASEAGMLVVMNPAPVAPGLVESGVLRRVDLLTPNRGELLALTGDAKGGTLETVASAWSLLRLVAGQVCVTLGPEGCLLTPDRSKSGAGTLALPAYPVEAVDTVGAGDCFSAALTVALSEGKPPHDAAHWALAAAALSVTRPGAQSSLPHRDEIERLVKQARQRV